MAVSALAAGSPPAVIYLQKAQGKLEHKPAFFIYLQAKHEPLAQTEQIFQHLFQKEYEGLCRYALNYMQDAQASEDVVQDTFIRIWETKRDKIASPDIRFYLYTAVRNNCISALRKSKSSLLQFPEHAPEGDPDPFITTSQRHEELNERQKKIDTALNALPPKCKEVFLLVKMQGMSYRHAAEMLGISVKTVEAQMGKALRMLRESLAIGLSLLILMSSIVKPLMGIGARIIQNVLS